MRGGDELTSNAKRNGLPQRSEPRSQPSEARSSSRRGPTGDREGKGALATDSVPVLERFQCSLRTSQPRVNLRDSPSTMPAQGRTSRRILVEYRAAHANASACCRRTRPILYLDARRNTDRIGMRADALDSNAPIH